ncbi:Pyroglutamylated RFamide peptide receptor [Sciurus carolinensis]|uniref:Pyroglutamylated RFamide peptide receptor n=1 Tax=Sciurus carolinensis TaxID=30640 RepID=A0AA41T053_SCICA|nr:Pyroglutamylated RFamide peptide receptor [Sciurus carolinensis]
MQALNITPERFSQLLRDHNLTRQQFIALYGLRPLVYTPELPARAKLALVLTGVLIFALALFGNALVVYVVTRSKAMRTVTNIFICSLALSDLLIAFFCIPVTMLQNISDDWLGGAPTQLMPPAARMVDAHADHGNVREAPPGHSLGATDGGVSFMMVAC